jgi:hypothetical protein
MLTELEIWVRDRRRAALHEAGHIIIANECGLGAYGHIFARHDPAPNENYWGGTTYLDPKQLRRLSRLRRCMIAVAGAVGELGEEELEYPGWLGEEYWFEPEIMSPTDWEGTGCRPGNPDRSCCRAIEAVGRLLAPGSPTRSALLFKARELIMMVRCVRYDQFRNPCGSVCHGP